MFIPWSYFRPGQGYTISGPSVLIINLDGPDNIYAKRVLDSGIADPADCRDVI